MPLTLWQTTKKYSSLDTTFFYCMFNPYRQTGEWGLPESGLPVEVLAENPGDDAL